MDDFLEKRQKSTAMQHWPLQQGFPGEVNRPSLPSLFHHGVHLSHCSYEQLVREVNPWPGFTSEGGEALFCLCSETFHVLVK